MDEITKAREEMRERMIKDITRLIDKWLNGVWTSEYVICRFIHMILG
jgi:hypothetical protein